MQPARRVGSVTLDPKRPDALDGVLGAAARHARRAADVDVGPRATTEDLLRESAPIVDAVEVVGELLCADAKADLEELRAGSSACEDVEVALNRLSYGDSVRLL